MRVFVTGATGFIGSAIVQELINTSHQVVGLARSDAAAAALTRLGIEAHRGALDDLDSLKRGAAASDGVIHTAFIHDFSDYAANGETDRLAVEALGAALAGSGRPLVITSGITVLPSGRLGTEEEEADPNSTSALVLLRKRSCCRWHRRVCAPQWCASRRRFTAMVIAASFRLSSPSRVKRAFRRMWMTGLTAGPQCIGSMLPISSGWRLRRVPQARDFMGSPTKACRSNRLPRSLPAA